MQLSDGTFVGYIYCITNAISGKRYVGQTVKTVHERWLDHMSDTRRFGASARSILHRAMAKYGVEKFTVFTLETVYAEDRPALQERLNSLEIYYIAEMKTLKPSGYNMTPGGAQVNIDNLVPVYCFNLDGTFIQRYNSMADAERQTGVGHSKISQACDSNNTGRLSAGGYLWSKTAQCPTYCGDRGKSHRRPVKQLDKEGNLVATFQSITEAASKLHLQLALIYKCCIGERKTTGGYRWSFIT